MAHNCHVCLSILYRLFNLYSKATINGSYFLSNYSYGLENHYRHWFDLKENRGAEMIIDVHRLLTITENGAPVNVAEFGSSRICSLY